MVVTYQGRLLFFCDNECNNDVDLKVILNESLDDGQQLELVASDSASGQDDDDANSFALLATCWIVCDRVYNCIRFHAALFCIASNFTVKLG
jgi:hypothetical protein